MIMTPSLLGVWARARERGSEMPRPQRVNATNRPSPLSNQDWGLLGCRPNPRAQGTSMADIPRLNGVIRALEAGKPAFTSFCQADPETAIAMSAAKYDGIVYEMEHNPWDIRALRDSLQYMLNRGQIAKSGSLAPSVTPMVRIPPNGAEKAQFQAKQALDLGAYGIVWPHISSVEEAHNAVAA